VRTDVFVIANKESGGLGCKRRRHNNGGFSSKSHKEIFPPLSVQHSDPDSCNDDVVLADPLDFSQVSGSTSEADFQSLTLLTKDVVERYLLEEKKLRLDLKSIYQDDHMWKLKTLDVNDIRVVKVHCAECGKDFGSSTGDHSKSTVHNFFMNFNLMSTIYIRNWCWRKEIRFEDHTQSQAGKGKTVVLTPVDHKRLVLEGIEILDALNEDIGGEKKTFDVIGDLNSEEVRSFWLRVKCNFCGNYFMLCPPEKNLEVNLKNHVNSLKHSKISDDHLLKAGSSALLSGRRGRLAKSTSTTKSSQQSLYTWFSNASKRGEFAPSSSIQKISLSSLCWEYWKSICCYGGKPYNVHGMLNDPHHGAHWVPEPHTKADVTLVG
jgi:ribosomal protein S27E